MTATHRLALLTASLFTIQSATAQPLNRVFSPGEYNKPEVTAKMMKLPDGFKVNVCAGEPGLVQPIAFTFDARGRIWVIENLSYPTWKPTGKDRVVILEDTDGDWVYEKRTVFWDKGNFASGIEVGFGGVWVGSPPNLLFIPDRNHDNVPDGDAVALLDGWGHHDTHETLNSFNWGPDGWLYGCQGVFTKSKVGKPGSKDKDRVDVNAGIWRYHPTQHKFEVFAHGGSNQWGIDFNDYGQAFMTACVIPHLFHVVQGGRYRRQAGSHFNPHTYFDIKTIRTHNHFAAAFAGSMIYLGDSFPDQYRNQIFMNNIHANKIHVDWLERAGSGYLGMYGPHDKPVAAGRRFADHDKRGTGFLNSGDKWYRGLALRVGPDGSVFVNDWYDKRPCHQLHPHDQDFDFKSGRIYRISYPAGTKPRLHKIPDFRKATDHQLVQHQQFVNDWQVRMSRRILQERAAAGTLGKDVRQKLLNMFNGAKNSERTKLRAMWALHVTGGVDATQALLHRSEYIRSWGIQLASEDGVVSGDLLAQFADLAKDDPSPVVRLYLASACQRIPIAQRWKIVENLIRHADDSKDQNLPQMYWYAIEPMCVADKTRAVQLAAKSQLPILRQHIARRIAAK